MLRIKIFHAEAFGIADVRGLVISSELADVRAVLDEHDLKRAQDGAPNVLT